MFVFPREGASARHQSLRSAQKRKRLLRLNSTWSVLALAALPMLAALPQSAIGQTTRPAGHSSSGLSVQGASAKTDAFLSSKMTSHPHSGWSSVIIQLTATPRSTQISSLQALQADVYRRLPIIHALAARVPTRNLNRLAALPFVRHLSTDNTVKKSDAFTVDSSQAAPPSANMESQAAASRLPF